MRKNEKMRTLKAVVTNKTSTKHQMNQSVTRDLASRGFVIAKTLLTLNI